MTVKTYDCFMFFNEFDLLKVRLEELWDVVDFFILVEGSHTHTGNPKPFYFKENEPAFLKYKDKLISRQVALPPDGKEPWFGWGREILQRTAINHVLAELMLEGDDIILSGDVDEIPRSAAVREYANRTDICCLEETNYHYNLNTQLETPTLDPKICRYRSVKEIGVADLRYYHHNPSHPVSVIKGAGWHLSFMGGTDKIIEKMKAYAHYDIRDPKTEFYTSRDNVESSVRERKSLFQRDDVKYRKPEDRGDLPQYILENRKHFVDAGWITEGV